MGKASANRRKIKKKQLDNFLTKEFPDRTFLCRKCGRIAVLTWRAYAGGKVIRCRECDGEMGTVRR